MKKFFTVILIFLFANICFCPLSFASVNYNNCKIIEKNGKIGISLDDKIIIKPVYKNVQRRNYNYFILQDDNDKYSYVRHSDGEITVLIENADFIDTWPKSYLLVKVEKNGKFGIEKYANKALQTIVPYEFDDITFCNYTYCIVKKGEKFGIRDILKENLKVGYEFDSIEPFKWENVLKVSANGKYGIYEYNKNKITKIKYEDIRIVNKGSHYYIQYKKNGKWKYLKSARLKLVTNTIKKGATYTVAITGLIITAPIWIWLLYSLSSELT